jgi:hypothetical protein
LPIVAGLFVLTVLPVVVRGEPLADDYHTCLRPAQIGLDGFLGESARRLGAVRPARFLEILVISSACRRVPFGLVILVPLGLTLLVAFLLRGLLLDLDLPPPWPDVGGAIWLLHPVGAESALWPSALHVPLGLAFALASLRLYRRNRYAWATVCALGAFLSLEQTILALPLAVWMVSRRDGRRLAVTCSGGLAAAVTIVYAAWPGTDPRSAVTIGERIAAIFKQPLWYIEFPGAGLGLHSIPLALRWAVPLSLVVVAIGGWLGVRWGRGLFRPPPLHGLDRGSLVRWGMWVALMVLLVNLPLMTTVPRGHTPRTFSPTWLVLSAFLPVVGARVWAPRTRWAWGLTGMLAAGALLAIALSVSVRLHTADFTDATSRYFAAHVSNGGVIAVCDVRRAVESDAPVGSYALDELVYTWSAQDSLQYETGRFAQFRLGGPLWGTDCPDLRGADLVVTFDQLLRIAGFHGR